MVVKFPCGHSGEISSLYQGQGHYCPNCQKAREEEKQNNLLSKALAYKDEGLKPSDLVVLGIPENIIREIW